MPSARKLPTFEHEGKLWTVDFRLREFRFVVLGEMPQFVVFDSPEGTRLRGAFLARSP